MVQLDIVRSCNSTLIKSQPLVAVFVGGTSGIGENAIRALAAAHSDQGRGLRLYIVGRNADAAKNIIADCVRVCSVGQFRFVKAEDLSLLKDVDHVCSEITRIEEEENTNGGSAKVDLLVMSQAGFDLSFQPRHDTKEGLDMLMSLLYYSRMRFILRLLPLLRASPLPAHIVSVYAAGMEGKIFPDDLSLRAPQQYGQANVRSHVTYMTTLFMENLAERYPGQLSLVHVFPGLVITNAFYNAGLPTWFKITARLAAPIMRPFTVKPEECGERILFLATPRYPAREAIESGTNAKRDEVSANGRGAGVATGTDGNRGSGAYACKLDGEVIPLKETYKKLREDGLAKKVWDHTMKVFDDIDAGNVFTG
ncbi:hypothetical protein MMC11_002011 [Xylographa trunciseda]|nr:hypothetical protein [Xylographa trunciseda]